MTDGKRFEMKIKKCKRKGSLQRKRGDDEINRIRTYLTRSVSATINQIKCLYCGTISKAALLYGQLLLSSS